MNEILSRPYIRRNFYTAIIFLALLLIVCRYLVALIDCGSACTTQSLNFNEIVLDNIWLILARLIDGLLVALLITVGLGSFIFWLAPPVNRIASLEPTDARAISEAFRTAMEDTAEWKYKGGTGTYLKAVTLPVNAKRARETRMGRRITIEILDPTDLDLCRSYRARWSQLIRLGRGIFMSLIPTRSTVPRF